MSEESPTQDEDAGGLRDFLMHVFWYRRDVLTVVPTMSRAPVEVQARYAGFVATAAPLARDYAATWGPIPEYIREWMTPEIVEAFDRQE